MKRLSALIVSATLVVLPTRVLALAGVGDTSDAILANILVENVKQSADITTQIANLQQIIQTTRENYEFVRSTYALADDLQHFDADKFLEDSRRQFLASNPVFGEAQGLAHDISKNGLHGGSINMWPLMHQVDVYRTNKKLEECGCAFDGAQLVAWAADRPDCQMTCQLHNDQAALFQKRRSGPPSLAPGGYDADAARRLAGALDTAVNDKDLRKDLLAAPPEPNVTEALVFNQLATQDPSAAQALLRQRALSAQAQSYAHSDWETAQRAGKNLNTGTASAITARSSSLAAEQLAAIREGQARELALAQSHASREAAAQQEDARRSEVHALHMADMLFLAVRSLRVPGTYSAGDAPPSLDPYAP